MSLSTIMQKCSQLCNNMYECHKVNILVFKLYVEFWIHIVLLILTMILLTDIYDLYTWDEKMLNVVTLHICCILYTYTCICIYIYLYCVVHWNMYDLICHNEFVIKQRTSHARSNDYPLYVIREVLCLWVWRNCDFASTCKKMICELVRNEFTNWKTFTIFYYDYKDIVHKKK